MRTPTQLALQDALKALALRGFSFANGAAETALLGLDVACASLVNVPAVDGALGWEHAGACRICGGAVARSFFLWIKFPQRHHCRSCGITVCNRRTCSVAPRGALRRCARCVAQLSEDQDQFKGPVQLSEALG